MIANLVYQQTITDGAGDLALTDSAGWRSFHTAFGAGVFRYCVRHTEALEYEIGLGHLSDAITLVRDTVIDSSNAGAKVSFSSGIKDVLCPADADYLSFENLQFTGVPVSFPLSGYKNRIKITVDHTKISSDLTGVSIPIQIHPGEAGWRDFMGVMDPGPITSRFIGEDGDGMSLDASRHWSIWQDSGTPISPLGTIQANRLRVGQSDALGGSVFLAPRFALVSDFDVTLRVLVAAMSNDGGFLGLRIYGAGMQTGIKTGYIYQSGYRASCQFRQNGSLGSVIVATATGSLTAYACRAMRQLTTLSGLQDNATTGVFLQISSNSIGGYHEPLIPLIVSERYSGSDDIIGDIISVDVFGRVVYPEGLFFGRRRLGATLGDGETQIPVITEGGWDFEMGETKLWLSGVDISSTEDTVFYLHYDPEAVDNDTYVSEAAGSPPVNADWRQSWLIVGGPETLQGTRNAGNLNRLFVR